MTKPEKNGLIYTNHINAPPPIQYVLYKILMDDEILVAMLKKLYYVLCGGLNMLKINCPQCLITYLVYYTIYLK